MPGTWVSTPWESCASCIVPLLVRASGMPAELWPIRNGTSRLGLFSVRVAEPGATDSLNGSPFSSHIGNSKSKAVAYPSQVYAEPPVPFGLARISTFPAANASPRRSGTPCIPIRACLRSSNRSMISS